MNCFVFFGQFFCFFQVVDVYVVVVLSYVYFLVVGFQCFIYFVYCIVYFNDGLYRVNVQQVYVFVNYEWFWFGVMGYFVFSNSDIWVIFLFVGIFYQNIDYGMQKFCGVIDFIFEFFFKCVDCIGCFWNQVCICLEVG